MTIYLNGHYMPIEEARISVLDRGFIFGDGVYEVIPAYSKHPFRMAEHLRRLQNSMDKIRITNPHSDAEWHKLASDVLRQDDEGKWVRHYDMGLAQPFRAATAESAQRDQAMLWAAYDAIRCPTLIVRGADSDLLSRETAAEMTRRGPRASLVEIPNVGHAPTFINDEQIAIARAFLTGT